MKATNSELTSEISSVTKCLYNLPLPFSGIKYNPLSLFLREIGSFFLCPRQVSFVKFETLQPSTRY